MIHTIGNNCLTVCVAEHGAELQSIRDSMGREYLWQGDPAYWKDRAINLFPYVARLTQGQYRMDGETYAMDIHGLAPYREFQVTEKTAERLVLQLESSEETKVHYPRDFAFRVIYALKARVLEITFEVENRDRRTLYFGLGGHPGFRVPLEEGRRFTDYALRFSSSCAPKRVGFTPQCFLSGQDEPFPLEDGVRIPLRHEMFDDDAIVLKDMAREVTLEADGGCGVRVSFPQMPYLGIWHMPHTDAPYVCIEPWCSLPSRQDEIAEFETQPDLLRSEAGETYRNTWTIEVL